MFPFITAHQALLMHFTTSFYFLSVYHLSSCLSLLMHAACWLLCQSHQHDKQNHCRYFRRRPARGNITAMVENSALAVWRALVQLVTIATSVRFPPGLRGQRSLPVRYLYLCCWAPKPFIHLIFNVKAGKAIANLNVQEFTFKKPSSYFTCRKTVHYAACYHILTHWFVAQTELLLPHFVILLVTCL